MKRRPCHSKLLMSQVLPLNRSILFRLDYVKTRETLNKREGYLMIFERSRDTMNVESLVERNIILSRFAGADKRALLDPVHGN